MRTIIAGSRSATDMSELLKAITLSNFEISSVISGGARGADKLGEEWAIVNKIPCEIMNADWSKYGRSAGHVRNREMASLAEAVILLWDGVSPGTKNMATISRALKLPTYIHMI